ncbi:hypothetical protein LCM27_01960 [Ruegeria marisrubri]|uniref:hypothetical protein n=1 Tax=Ruegeria marisrubri TaxID=1685379 RepID=UPI001CD2D08E|nr:hypothetical protein [Ruegeria marisrubri]MCA0905157.1 hypothetical protein [Ruegeria marisrubri]
MSVSSHLVETPEDLAVKVKAWKATEAEVMRFGREYAEDDGVGLGKPSAMQDAIAGDAGDKGYPTTVVREVGSILRRIEVAEEANKPADVAELKTKLRAELCGFANKIGLGKAYAEVTQ